MGFTEMKRVPYAFIQEHGEDLVIVTVYVDGRVFFGKTNDVPEQSIRELGTKFID